MLKSGLLTGISNFLLNLPQKKMPSKGPLIVEREQDGQETWSVCPTPGLCIKFRDAQMPSSSIGPGPPSSKFFVNLAHCMELPAPQGLEMGEDEVAKLMDERGPDGYRIPMCVGELDTETEDNSGQRAMKVDVVVNSDFFHQRISESEFFLQLTLRIICEAVKIKYGIQLDTSKQVVLRNKKCQGELAVQRIRKRPAQSLVQQQDMPSGSKSSASIVMKEGEEKAMDIDDIEGEGEEERKRPRNFKVQIVDGGQWMDIRVRVRDPRQEGQQQLVSQVERITLKMNDDRVVVLLDGSVLCADFFIPFRMQDEEAIINFDPDQCTLHIRCPIKWN